MTIRRVCAAETAGRLANVEGVLTVCIISVNSPRSSINEIEKSSTLIEAYGDRSNTAQTLITVSLLNPSPTSPHKRNSTLS